MPIAPTSISHAEIHILGRLTSGGSNSKNTDYVFHYRRGSTAPPLSKSGLDAAFQAAVAVPLLAAANVRWEQISNTVRWLDDAQDAAVPFSHPNVGGIGTDGGQTFDTVYCLLRTGLRGKNYRGSKHFAGVSEADTTQPASDILNAAAITRWTAVITGMAVVLADGSGNNWTLEVVSRNLSQVKMNPTVIVGNNVALGLLNKRIGRMKRREVASVY